MNQFLKSLLRPIARLCLRRRIPIQGFIEAAKHAFLAAAEEELASSGSKASTSRIAAMTGLQRKEIKRIEQGADDLTAGMHLLAKILTRWCHDRNFKDKHGKPAKLSIAPEQNDFAKLVLSVSSDLSPYTALFELERCGAVERKGSVVQLLDPTIEISADQSAALNLFAEDIDRLIETLENNVFDSQRDLHARTEYDNIAPSALPKIRRWILKYGAEFHADLRAYLNRFDRDLNPALDNSAKRARISVGTFCAVNCQGKKTEGK